MDGICLESISQVIHRGKLPLFCTYKFPFHVPFMWRLTAFVYLSRDTVGLPCLGVWGMGVFIIMKVYYIFNKNTRRQEYLLENRLKGEIGKWENLYLFYASPP